MFQLNPELDRVEVPDHFEFTEDRRRMAEADVVVFHLPSLDRVFLRRKRAGQLWVAWYMECEQNYRRLRSSRLMGRFDLQMNYHQDADIMVTYIPEPLRILQPESLQAGRHEHMMCSFVSGYVDRSGRLDYLEELSRYMEIHRFGRCGDRVIHDDRGLASKLSITSRYKFSFSFENAIAPDYVTEKFYDPLLAGSVPVYLGAPNVESYAPVDDCFINVADFSGPAELADYLLQLDRDQPAFERLVNWRERPFRPGFKALCENTHPSAFDGLCSVLTSFSTGNDRPQLQGSPNWP